MTPRDAGLDVLVPRQPTAADRERLPRAGRRPTLGEVLGLLAALVILLVALGACACVLTVWARA